MMKLKIVFLTVVLGMLCNKPSQAQSYTKNIANQSSNTVEFVLAGSPITIQGYSGDTIIVKNTAYQAPPQRAKGLHPVSGGGKDNSGIGLSVHQQKGALQLVQTQAGAGNFTVKVPNQIRVKINEVNWGGGDITISEMRGEIEINAKTANIQLQNITGPVIANTTSGNVDVSYAALSDANPSSISIVSGHIDVTLPAVVKTSLNLNTITGEIYTDFDIKMEEQKGNMRQIGGQTIEGTLNGGGVALKLKAISGNIYLRKEK